MPLCNLESHNHLTDYSYLLCCWMVVTMSASPQEQEDRRQTWPGQQYPPSYQNLGEGAAPWGCL